VNWYLGPPTVPRSIAGGAGLPKPEAAPYMAPELVRDAGWTEAVPSREQHLVIHRLSLRSLVRLARAGGRGTVVATDFSIATEGAYFDLARVYSDGRDLREGRLANLASLKPGNGKAFVLATGPSAKTVDLSAIDADLRITCNSAVRDHDLLQEFRPNVIAFNDRVFHFGPSRYAAAFREDLRYAFESTDALFVTSDQWVVPLLNNFPELAERLIVVESDTGPWGWPTGDRCRARATGNVLTNLMLPIAFALSDHIAVAGCDGRARTETYFWKHNASTQYTDELMQAAFAAHPAFFRDRDYADYYDDHCRELEEFFRVAEGSGKVIVGASGSHMLPLVSRGARDLTTQIVAP
jgi:hypothetical protein